MTAPVVKVEMSLPDADGFVLDVPNVDVLVLGEEDHAWEDISTRILQDSPLTFGRGVQRSQGPWWRYESARASMRFDNLDGAFDPLYLDGPFALGGVSGFRPGVGMRVLFDNEVHFLGELDSFTSPIQGSLGWAPVNVLCSDAVETLKSDDRPALSEPVGQGESGGERIHRILDRVEFPMAMRDIDTDVKHTMQETTLARDAWSEILQTADSDRGYVWFTREGVLTYRTPMSIDHAPVGTIHHAGTGDLVATRLTPSYDRNQVYNSALIARANGFAIQPEPRNEESIQELKLRSVKRTDLMCELDGQAYMVGFWIVQRYGTLQYRIEEAEIKLNDDSPDAMWTFARSLDIGQVIRTYHQTPDGREIVVDGMIRGLFWTIDRKNKSFTLLLSFQSVPLLYDPFILDSATDGVLNQNALSY